MNKLPKNIILFISLVALGYLVFSCGEEEKKFDVFNVDSTRIAAEVTDSNLGVKFNPPKLWKGADSEIQEKRTVNLDYSKRTFRSFVYTATGLYYNAGRRSVLSIGYLTLRENKEDKVPTLDDYVVQSTEKWKDPKVRKTTFSKNGIDFTRMDIEYGVWYTVRILFYNKSGELVQFEYSTQLNKKEAELPWIKASIGTIRLM